MATSCYTTLTGVTIQVANLANYKSHHQENSNKRMTTKCAIAHVCLTILINTFCCIKGSFWMSRTDPPAMIKDYLFRKSLQWYNLCMGQIDIEKKTEHKHYIIWVSTRENVTLLHANNTKKGSAWPFIRPYFYLLIYGIFFRLKVAGRRRKKPSENDQYWSFSELFSWFFLEKSSENDQLRAYFFSLLFFNLLIWYLKNKQHN